MDWSIQEIPLKFVQMRYLFQLAMVARQSRFLYMTHHLDMIFNSNKYYQIPQFESYKVPKVSSFKLIQG